jgi:hypothetical protein
VRDLAVSLDLVGHHLPYAALHFPTVPILSLLLGTPFSTSKPKGPTAWFQHMSMQKAGSKNASIITFYLSDLLDLGYNPIEEQAMSPSDAIISQYKYSGQHFTART